MDSISRIFYKQLIGAELTPDERGALNDWLAQSDENREAGARLSDLSHLEHEYRLREVVDTARAQERMMQSIAALPQTRRRRFYRRAAVAASIAAVIAVGGVFMIDTPKVNFNTHQTAQSTLPASAETVATRQGRPNAIIKTASGKTIVIKDTVVVSDRVEGMLISANVIRNQIKKLQLEVPRGGEFKIMLEDSTEVWLNSESTLKYPEVFGADERRVEVVGEAYFKVKKDTTRPFYVVTGGQCIRVYGTTFNIRGYRDESTILTTLESGSISMTRLDGSGGELKLSPGHQTVFDCSEEKVTVRTVNPEMVTGWRKGKFIFDEQPLSAIMRDLARWYNFKYEFADLETASIVFKGSISRHGTLEEALEILEYSGSLRFTVADDRIFIEKRRHR